MKPRAVVFDANGTSFDVHTVVTQGGGIDGGPQRPIGTVETATARIHMASVSHGAIRRLLEFHGSCATSVTRQLHIAMNDAGLDRVMKAYLFADCVRDVEPALESLNRVPLVILPSASLKMLEPAVRHNGLESSFTDLISVDRARIYKPTPRAYYLATESL